jgi:GT2 family glycosyltransferase
VEPLLSAVIVNHDQWPLALAQLEAHENQNPVLFAQIQWLVIHNGPEPVDFASCKSRAIKQIEIAHRPNRGYGEAVNYALRHTSAPFLLALNADLFPEPSFLDGVAERTRQLSSQTSVRVGVVGFGLRNADGSPQGSSGSFPTFARILAGLVKPRGIRKYRKIVSQRPVPVPWVTGACILLDRRCATQIGGFDERFFLYYEDVDLCLRARQSSWTVEYDPRPVIRHLQPYHLRPLTLRMAYLARRGLLLYFLKHRPRWEFRALAGVVRVESRLRRPMGWRRIGDMARSIGGPGATDVPLDPAMIP